MRVLVVCVVALACARGAQETRPVAGPARPFERPAQAEEPKAAQSSSAPEARFDAPLESESFPSEPAPPIPRLSRIETPKGLSQARASCRAFAARHARSKDCPAGDPVELLGAALARSDEARRDQALADLEACGALPAATVRALRADLERACADALVEPLWQERAGRVSEDVGSTLLGLALAAMLSRVETRPPPYRGGDLERYRARAFRPWLEGRLGAIDGVLANAGVDGLHGYGRAVLAVAHAGALRVVHGAARGVEIPRAFRNEYEKRREFYGAIDRDLAALKGDLASANVRAATALSAAGIRRARDADGWYRMTVPKRLQKLNLEPSPLPEPRTGAERVAALAPAFYASRLLPAEALDDTRVFRLRAQKGFSPAERQRLRRDLSQESAEVMAEYRAAMARRTLDGVQWDEAVRLLSTLPTRSPRAELILATALAARRGPRSFAEAAAANGPRVLAPHVEPLERFGESDAPARLRAFALNNAAQLLAHRVRQGEFEPIWRANRRAADLATEPRTRGCIWALWERWFMEKKPKCDLPLAP